MWMQRCNPSLRYTYVVASSLASFYISVLVIQVTYSHTFHLTCCSVLQLVSAPGCKGGGVHGALISTCPVAPPRPACWGDTFSIFG